ncbi:hypothetical protein [Vannielia litorea]|uniref:hypothetical protein n=1 Tax=Vannielia litorea TaxID=1217970 RepID=UPI001BD0B4C9|nr:hypothetical protein [Vannielia litorea]MBS8228672.1 hypothetical protein [Vannielia litorea]
MTKLMMTAATVLSLTATPMMAATYSWEVWQSGDGGWYGGIKSSDCKLVADCVETVGKYRTKGAARKEAKAEAKKREKEESGFYDDGRTDGGLCSQPGVEC